MSSIRPRRTPSLVVAAALVAAMAPAPARAQDPTAEVDRIFAWATPATPGCAVAVSQHGKVVVNRAYGLAIASWIRSRGGGWYGFFLMDGNCRLPGRRGCVMVRPSTRSTSMSQSDLSNLLKQLHARLGNAQSLDADDRRLLSTVLADIESALANGAAARQPPDGGIESLAVKFEADHPALAETLRRVADTLAKAGI
jgi:hypothetical protein